jgi:hypothetical protein
MARPTRSQEGSSAGPSRPIGEETSGTIELSYEDHGTGWARAGQDRWSNPRRRSRVMSTAPAELALPIPVGGQARPQEERDTCDGSE